jgi:hypothetical protein
VVWLARPAQEGPVSTELLRASVYTRLLYVWSAETASSFQEVRVVFNKHQCFLKVLEEFLWDGLSALATDATCQLDILGHDSHALGVDGGQVGVLKQANEVGFCGLLKRQHCRGLEAQVGLEILR